MGSVVFNIEVKLLIEVVVVTNGLLIETITSMAKIAFSFGTNINSSVLLLFSRQYRRDTRLQSLVSPFIASTI